MKNRDLSLDWIRIVACFMVVLMHSPLPGIGTPGFVLSGLSYITAPCIGLFFMVSGALLLPKDSCKEFGAEKFLKRRSSKILIPIIFWSVLGYALNYFGIKNEENGILWFMFVLAGLYLLTPILYRWLSIASQKEEELYLLIWAISLCIPFIRLLFDWIVDAYSWIYYFYGYAGYFVLGHYLMHYEQRMTHGWRIWLLGTLFCLFTLVSPLAVLFFRWEVDFYSLFWYLSISVALFCILWWLLLRRMSCQIHFGERFRSFVILLSNLTFGIYLVHILIMRLMIWKIGLDLWINYGGIFQISITSILTFALSGIIVLILSKIKGIRMLVGF